MRVVFILIVLQVLSITVFANSRQDFCREKLSNVLEIISAEYKKEESRAFDSGFAKLTKELNLKRRAVTPDFWKVDLLT